MAHVKAAGTSKNLKDSKPKMLGVKIYGDQRAKMGDIIVRQRGQKYRAGDNVLMGRDHTIFAVKDGNVQFKVKRVHQNGTGHTTATYISIVPATK